MFLSNVHTAKGGVLTFFYFLFLMTGFTSPGVWATTFFSYEMWIEPHL